MKKMAKSTLFYFLSLMGILGSISNTCTAQIENPVKFFENLCNYHTDNSAKYGGIKMELSIPCKWKESKSNNPRILKEYSYDLKAQPLVSVSHTLTISAFKGKNIISSNEITISGIKGREMIEKNVDNTQYGKMFYLLFYYDFVYKNNIITIGYSVVSLSEQLYDVTSVASYKSLFRNLISNSKFLN